jgi:S-adenosylmethionine-diacylgycerolhomoserine-N-methlytransferase
MTEPLSTAPTPDAAHAMDRMYRFQTAIYDLTRKPYLLGRDPLIAALDPPPGGSVLEMACGTGRNLVKAAGLWPNARFYGADISAVMLAKAAQSVERAGLSGRIALTQADAVSFNPATSFGVARFDRVFISYALSMIPPWQEALETALAVTAPEGRLSIVDFGDSTRQPAWLAPILMRWLGLFDVRPRTGLVEAAEALAARAGRPLRIASPLGGYVLALEFGPVGG